MPKKRRTPAYTHHKSTGQARVRIDGRDHYLGTYGSAESREEYDRLVTEWVDRQDVKRVTLVVDDLCLLYLDHAAAFYRGPDGKPTSEPACIRHALRFLIDRHGRTRCRDFGPRALKEVRQAMIDAKLARTTINKQVHRIKRAFAWGVENELVPAGVNESLRCVASLREGRSEAAEPEPVEPVDEDAVEAILPKLTRVLQAMVRLQLLSGCRPGEVCSLRPCDVTIGTDGVWTFRPPHHKTRHRGKDRRIFFGPQAQEILRPFLDREPDEYCFRPRDSEAERNAERRLRRQSPMTPSHASRKPTMARLRPPGERYMKDGYCRAIARACRAAGVDSWSPNQLRHARATLLRKLYGIEAAQLVLGHSDPGVTLVYAERNFAAAADIMREIG